MAKNAIAQELRAALWLDEPFDRTAVACAAMLEALGASFRAPPMATP